MRSSLGLATRLRGVLLVGGVVVAVVVTAPAARADEMAAGRNFHMAGRFQLTTDRSAAVAVLLPGDAPLSGITQLAGGADHSCALLASGQARCWGHNGQGRLGDGTTTEVRSTPVVVLSSPGGPPLTGIKQLVTGDSHTCAVLTSGQAFCWGSNDDKQLGDGTSTNRSTPVAVRSSRGGSPLMGVKQLAAGAVHTCAVLTSGQARCWGYNGEGRLGNGTTTDRATPVVVRSSPGGPALTGITEIVTGRSHTCALLASGQARCWGSNDDKQLGDGTTTDRWTPITVVRSPAGQPLNGVKGLTTGDVHTCAVLTSGQARCWGSNVFGQLGDGTTTNRLRPAAVRSAPGGPPLNGIERLATGGSRRQGTCAVLTSGQARCWGNNFAGQLGDGTIIDRSTPVAVLGSPGDPPLDGITQLAAGGRHTCALLTSGQARCWGYNFAGQLGDGTSDDRFTPVIVLEGA